MPSANLVPIARSVARAWPAEAQGGFFLLNFVGLSDLMACAGCRPAPTTDPRRGTDVDGAPAAGRLHSADPSPRAASNDVSDRP